MTHHDALPAAPSAPPPTPAGRRTPPGKRRVWRRIIVGTAGALVLVVAAVAAYGAYLYHDVGQVRRSAAIAGPAANPQDGTTLLVMGLDSRVDENGQPLPASMYRALHTGNQNSGGLNSNVLMLVHFAADGKHAVGISIPRDDYVAFPGCPDGECHGKIKQAYGLAADQKQRQLSAHGVTGAAAYQQARDAGRAAEIRTVDQFLGVHVNGFVEVTMVAFFQFAQVVQPIKVCVKEDTVDTFSGAHFHAGVQEISATQALAFVRQRRDTRDPSLNFTDLDRERRQQAFIISLLTQLKSANTLLDPSKTLGLIDVAKKNIVLSQNLDTLSLVRLADHLAGGGLHFYTLPIKGFGVIGGQDVNLVNQAQVKSTVARLLSGKPAPKPATTSATAKSATPQSATPDATSVPTAVTGAGGGRSGPPVTALTDINSGGVPCVK